MRRGRRRWWRRWRGLSARQETLCKGLQALVARGPLGARASAQAPLDPLQRASVGLGAAEARRDRLFGAATARAGARRRRATHSVPHRAQSHVRGPAHTTPILLDYRHERARLAEKLGGECDRFRADELPPRLHRIPGGFPATHSATVQELYRSG